MNTPRTPGDIAREILDIWNPGKSPLTESDSGMLFRGIVKALDTERTARLEAEAKLKEAGLVERALRKLLKSFKDKFDAFGRYQFQHLSKGLEEAEKCWPEVSDSGMLDFTDLFKAIEAPASTLAQEVEAEIRADEREKLSRQSEKEK